MDLYEIVKKLAGPIAPVGETNEDQRRLENMVGVIELTDKLLADIKEITAGRTRPEHSISHAGRIAHTFIGDVRIWLNEEAGES